MPYVKTSKEVIKYTSFLEKKSSRKLRMYHWNNKLNYIPKCIVTKQNAYFAYNGYTEVCKTLVRYDKQIHTKPFKWLNLLKAGACPDELALLKNNKYLHKIRDKFNHCNDLNDFRQRLILMKFKEGIIHELLNDLDFSN